MKEELTHQEQYELKLKIIANSYKAEYAGCGTHQIELDLNLGLDEMQNILEQILKIKGIKLPITPKGN